MDKIQTRFLKELELTEEQAFLDFNFAPCRVRRNIAILGLIHKRVLGKCHPSYDRLLPFSQVKSIRANAHNKQLYGHWCEITSHQALFNSPFFSWWTGIIFWSSLQLMRKRWAFFNPSSHRLCAHAASNTTPNGDRPFAHVMPHITRIHARQILTR